MTQPKAWHEGNLRACSGQPVEIFIHDPESLAHEELMAQALSICATCPFKAECLELGKSTQSVGVFGGQWLDLPDEEPPAEVKKK